MTAVEKLKLTTHVGRDLLASAAGFKNEAAVVWEYVVNSLQYVDEGLIPKVLVSVQPRNKKIEIRDNGRGMNSDDLSRFFQMHGENIDRIKGRPGRGKFGTGKSAAFGIGNKLIVDSRRNGIRNVVELSREAIDNSTGDDIELNWMVRNEKVDYKNGTKIVIDNIFIQKINLQPIIDYIERHLQIFRAMMPEVAVNEHICQVKEPSLSESLIFKPSVEQAKIIGDIELKVHVSNTPLPLPEQGISISAGLGNLVAIETSGVERKEMGNYLFGEVDVPLLEEYQTPIEAYDQTRSLQLNTNHPVVQVLLPFIGSKLESVRKIQVQKLNEARKSEEARRLSSEAQQIADLLNNDFKNVLGKLDNIRTASASPGDLGSNFGGKNDADDNENVWVEGTQELGDIETTRSDAKPLDNEQNDDNEEMNTRDDPNIGKAGKPNPDAENAVDPSGGQGKKASKPRGGFSVEYRNLGFDTDRSKYDKTKLAILINLDHPVVNNAMKLGGIEDVNFKRLSYEIAFTEYSVALGYELAEIDPDIPADDLLYEVRSTLNRISTRAASLYS